MRSTIASIRTTGAGRASTTAASDENFVGQTSTTAPGGGAGADRGGASSKGGEKIAASSSSIGANVDTRSFRDDIYHREVSTSLHLQLLLYFGFWFKCFAAVTLLLAGWYKSRWTSREGLAIAVYLLSLVYALIFEPARYYLGYRGNLTENVPNLLLFLILSIFPSFIVLFFLLIAPDVLPELGPSGKCHPRCVLPVEKAIYYVDVAFSTLQIVFGVNALQRLIAKNTTEFYLQQDEQVASAFADATQSHTFSPSARLRRAFGPGAGGAAGS
ncbi:unnamed protein product [Amoebophrya sp. A25]|nr:unnamed protein product [Amoebophrya sp. A25]|eukprot:GSA25T00003135001.1